jgi:hypothetical protein
VKPVKVHEINRVNKIILIDRTVGRQDVKINAQYNAEILKWNIRDAIE